MVETGFQGGCALEQVYEGDAFCLCEPHVAVALTEEGAAEDLAWSAKLKLRRCASEHPDFTVYRTDDDTALIAMRYGVTILGEKGMWERDSACPLLLRSLGIEACEQETIRAIVSKDSFDEELDLEEEEDEEDDEEDKGEEDSPEGEEDTEA